MHVQCIDIVMPTIEIIYLLLEPVDGCFICFVVPFVVRSSSVWKERKCSFWPLYPVHNRVVIRKYELMSSSIHMVKTEYYWLNTFRNMFCCWWLFVLFFDWSWCERRIVSRYSMLWCVWEKGFAITLIFNHKMCTIYSIEIVTIRWMLTEKKAICYILIWDICIWLGERFFWRLKDVEEVTDCLKLNFSCLSSSWNRIFFILLPQIDLPPHTKRPSKE